MRRIYNGLKDCDPNTVIQVTLTGCAVLYAVGYFIRSVKQ